MAVFSSISGFVRRHKRKFLVAIALLVLLYYLVNELVLKKFRNFQRSLQQELYIKEQIKRRFIQTQNDCYYTLLALLPVLVGPIVSNSPTELITKALKLKKLNVLQSKEISDSLLTTDNLILHANADDTDLQLYLNKSKTELWRLLKIKTISRFLTLVYLTSSLLLLTRLQLNILARKSYLQSAISMTTSQQIDDNENYVVEQSYLSLSWWLLNKGWESLSFEIESKVEYAFRNINARTEITVDEFNQLLLNTVESLNANPQALLNAIWPNVDDLNLTLLNTNPALINDYNDDFLKLINETNLIINNEFFLNSLNQMIVANLATLLQHLDGSGPLKLANVLAQLSIQCEALCNNNESQSEELAGNEYVNNANGLEILDDFAASIYSNIE